MKHEHGAAIIEYVVLTAIVLSAIAVFFPEIFVLAKTGILFVYNKTA